MLLWSLDERRFALPLQAALEVTAVAALTEGTHEGPLLGHLDLRGASLPAFDARRLLGMDQRQVVLSDRYIIARVRDGRIALLVDSVEGIGSARSEPAPSLDLDAGSGLRLARVDDDDRLPLVQVLDLDALVIARA